MSQLKEYAVLPQHVVHLDNDSHDPEAGLFEKEQLIRPDDAQQPAVPSICGMPLKYVS